MPFYTAGSLFLAGGSFSQTTSQALWDATPDPQPSQYLPAPAPATADFVDDFTTLDTTRWIVGPFTTSDGTRLNMSSDIDSNSILTGRGDLSLTGSSYA